MIDRLKLAYVVLELRRVPAWYAFLDRLLEPEARAKAARHLRVERGRADDIVAIGLELADDEARTELAGRLAAAGVASRTDEKKLVFHDPLGTRIEAVVGEGGGAADTGFGHVVLATREVAAMERFYVGTLGFGVTERLAARVGPLDVRGAFLHCNPRHHSIALLDLPQRRRLNHLMLEAASVREVLRAHDRARAASLPFSLELGEHPDPDGTLSFYLRTPAGFDLEIGAGGSEIQPAGWREGSQSTTSRWGHRPTLGLKLRAAANLIAARLG
jgi:catechol 2,3-dioxygenase-like lactoylglutathione lyase family enzyme